MFLTLNDSIEFEVPNDCQDENRGRPDLKNWEETEECDEELGENEIFFVICATCVVSDRNIRDRLSRVPDLSHEIEDCVVSPVVARILSVCDIWNRPLFLINGICRSTSCGCSFISSINNINRRSDIECI